MNILFDEYKINGMTITNRFVRSATWEGMAAIDGAVTKKLIDTMVDLAKGGVGLIISSHSFVSPEGQAGPFQIGVYKDELISGLKDMTSAVHSVGGKIIMQLAHAGTFAAEGLTGLASVVASDFEGLAETPRNELKIEEIEEIIKAFADAAGRAKKAGFDGVQIHAAHGYLLSQFLSPHFNRRKDHYGGDVAGRTKIIVDVYQAIRNVVGDDYPVLIKMNCGDFIENGLSADDALEAGKLLADAGIDAIELSGGTLISGKLLPSRTGIKSEEKEAYFREEAMRFKENISVPLILVGGIRTPGLAEVLVGDGKADLISMSRAFIREPGLIKRWQDGILRRADCISCNQCFGPGIAGEGIYCVAKERQNTE